MLGKLLSCGMTLVKRGKKKPAPAPPVDGRELRSVRTREAIVTAVMALLAEREQEVTMELVAARAGVSVRTLYRQFQDTDTLFLSLYQRVGGAAAELALDWTPAGTLLGDMDALVEARARMFVAIEPFMRMRDRIVLPHREDPALVEESRKRLRADLRWLVDAHVATPSGDDLHALEAWLSVEAWTNLREEQGLSRPRALAVMKRTARTLASALGRGD